MSEKTTKKREMRYEERELSIIKNTFAGNDEIIPILRKIFLQISLDPIELAQVQTLRSQPDTLAILRKTFLPTIDVYAPLNQVVDLWMTVNIKEKSLEAIELEITAREKLIDYLEQQLAYLEKDIAPTVQFDKLTKILSTKKLDTATNFIMRNTLLGHVDQQLRQLVLLAGTKDETTEETLARLQKDSTK